MTPPPTRRGRPSVDPDRRPARVQVTLAAKVYDALFHRAQTRAISIPEVIRRRLSPANSRHK